MPKTKTRKTKIDRDSISVITNPQIASTSSANMTNSYPTHSDYYTYNTGTSSQGYHSAESYTNYENTFSFKNSNHSTQPNISKSIPISETELERRLEQVIKSLGLPDKVKKDMRKLPPDKKWDLILQNQKKLENEILNQTGMQNISTNFGKFELGPQKYIVELKDLQEVLKMQNRKMSESYQPSVKDLQQDRLNDYAGLEYKIEEKIDQLRTALRTQPTKFTQQFIEQHGFALLLSFLQCMNESMKEGRIHYGLLGCIKVLLNDQVARKHIVAHPNGMLIVASISLPCSNLKIKISCLEILAGVSQLAGGHKKILTALTFFQECQKERSRFSRLVSDLDHDFPHDGAHEIELKNMILGFINAMMRGGLGASINSIENLQLRLHLRYELLSLGFASILEKLLYQHGQHNEILKTHIKVFQDQRKQDEHKLAVSHKLDHLDSKSSSELFQAIRKRTSYTEAWQPFTSILYHMAIMPIEIAEKPQHWLLIEKCINSIIMQRPDGTNPDYEYLQNIDINSSLNLVTEVHELKNAKEKITKLKAERDDYKSKFEKNRTVLDGITKEKDTALRQCEKASSRVSEITDLMANLERQLTEEKGKCFEMKNEINLLRGSSNWVSL